MAHLYLYNKKILDLKPYIPSHDKPENVKIANWVEITSKMESDF